MKNKKLFLVLFLILIIVCITAFTYFKKNNKDSFYASLKFLKPNSQEENIEILLGEEIPTSKDYNSDFMSDIVWIDKIEEMNKKIGLYRGIVISGIQLDFVTLTVIDKTPPVIQNVADITIFEGESLNLEDQVKAIDDSNEDIKVAVKGDYSFEKEGTYSLTYEAVDSSGNLATADFHLIVKKKEVEKPKPVDPPKVEKPQTNTSKTSKGYDITKVNGVYYINGILIANKTYALPSSYAPGGLTKETNAAFSKMQADAAKEGINLKIISGYRSYSKQQSTYNRYVNRDGKSAADRYSARPGHSEHQTGLAFDVNSLEQSFGNTKEGKWLSANCYKYGFILRYPQGKEAITGYMYEPWHFRYIGDEASKLYNNGSWITLEEYLGIDSKYSS